MRAAQVTTPILVASLFCSLACEDPVFTNPTVLDISVTVSADSVLPGTPIAIRVSIANRTDRRVEFDDDGCGFFSVVVLDSHDSRVDNLGPSVGCISFGTVTEVFQPGEERRFSLSWSAQVDSHGGDAERRPVPAGVYRIVASLGLGLVRTDPVLVFVLPTRVLSLKPEPEEAEVGEAVRITIALENRLARPVELEVLSACTFGVFVTVDGERAADLSGDCTIVDGRLPLAAHQRYEETTTWIPTAPGDYRLEAQLGVPTLQPDLRAQARLPVSPRPAATDH